jgi:excisionase family DNA binding protein
MYDGKSKKLVEAAVHEWQNPVEQPAPPRLAYSVTEAAQTLGVSTKTIRRLLARGLLRASKALRHKLIPAEELKRFLHETL